MPPPDQDQLKGLESSDIDLRLFQFSKPDQCPVCQGDRKVPCPTCDGDHVERVSLGVFSVRMRCRTCYGSVSVVCPFCEGVGLDPTKNKKQKRKYREELRGNFAKWNVFRNFRAPPIPEVFSLMPEVLNIRRDEFGCIIEDEVNKDTHEPDNGDTDKPPV